MPKWPYHADDEIAAVERVLRSGLTNYWQGEEGQSFEREFADYTGAAHALAVTNGTTALELALSWLDAPDGAEIIVPCRTFVATASAVYTCGMKPVIAEIDPASLNVTVETLEARRTARTVGVIVVHYAGLPCHMPEIANWCQEHGLVLIEDCAHAHGAKINGQHVGTFGDVGTFSFCVGKTMSTGGEGGMVITNTTDIRNRMAARRDHGRYQMVGGGDPAAFQYTVEEPGTNLRMTEMQAAIGRIQLRKLDGWVARRNAIHSRYVESLGDGFPTPVGYSHGRYMSLHRVDNRDSVMRELNALGVPARIGGCPNIGKERAFANQPECPDADAIGRRTLMLPCYPTYTDAEIDEICEHVKTVCGNVR